MDETPLKPAQAADAAAAARADEAAARQREWWRRTPQVLTRPREVFAALAETDDLDVDARSEPVLLIVILSGIAGLLLTSSWSTLMDDPSIDGLVVAVVTFVGALMYGAAGYVLLGLALWIGAKGVGVQTPWRVARQIVAFAAVPFALTLVVTLPVALLVPDGDWFHKGGADEGLWRGLVETVAAVGAVWWLALVVVGLRTTFRLPWRGVVGALALAAVIVAALVVVPSSL